MAWLREYLSKRLDPKAHEKARRYEVLRSFLSDAQRWMGYEFPEVDETIYWAKIAEVNYFRGLDEPSLEAVPGKPWIHTISDFREHMRAKRKEPINPT